MQLNWQVTGFDLRLSEFELWFNQFESYWNETNIWKKGIIASLLNIAYKPQIMIC